MMTVDELVAKAKQDGGSDIHLICGLPPKYRVSGGLENMSDEPLTVVNEKLNRAREQAHALGVNREVDPFMTLSFMALPVIPTLRLTTKGMFDVTKQEYV